MIRWRGTNQDPRLPTPLAMSVIGMGLYHFHLEHRLCP